MQADHVVWLGYIRYDNIGYIDNMFLELIRGNFCNLLYLHLLDTST
jgi:hypothetical protein